MVKSSSEVMNIIFVQHILSKWNLYYAKKGFLLHRGCTNWNYDFPKHSSQHTLMQQRMKSTHNLILYQTQTTYNSW